MQKELEQIIEKAAKVAKVKLRAEELASKFTWEFQLDYFYS